MGKGGDGVEAPPPRKQTRPRSALTSLFGWRATLRAPPDRGGRESFIPQAPSPEARRLRSDMTIAEKRLWEELRKLKLRAIRRQAAIGSAGFVIDFAHHGSRIVIDVASPWHDDDAARLRDAERVMRGCRRRATACSVIRWWRRSQRCFRHGGADSECNRADDGVPWGAGRWRRTRLCYRPPGFHPHPCPAPIEGAGSMSR